MKVEYTVKGHNRRLILIFAGWGTDASFYRHIAVEGYDVMVAWGYDDLSFPADIFGRYHTVCLFAWSLGVEAAARVIPFDRLAMAVAVNGTETPLSDTRGIPKEIFCGTAANLSDRTLLKFRKRMAGTAFNDFESLFPATPPADLALELEAIASRQALPASPGQWDRAYVSSGDRIFPPDNMQAFWETHPSRAEIVHLDTPHCVDLAPIVRACVPETDKVGRRFSKASATYSANAPAQAAAARLLASMIAVGHARSVVEIGPADGLFSRLWVPKLTPREIDYVDLYPIAAPGLAPAERVIVADAEDLMESEACLTPASRDAVVSASAIQWFANPRRFFRNAARALRPGALLAVSTFLPGNLRELAAVNPHTLLYRSPEALTRMLEPFFTDIRFMTDSVALSFPSPRHTLSHLSRTGAGGSFSTPGGSGMKRLPLTLTYEILCITARRKQNPTLSPSQQP